MWSQDAMAVAAATPAPRQPLTQLTPFTEPVQTTNASGLAAQSAAIALPPAPRLVLSKRRCRS